MKNYKGIPALRGVDVWPLMKKDLLPAERVSWTSVFYLVEPKHVWQSWYVHHKVQPKTPIRSMVRFNDRKNVRQRAILRTETHTILRRSTSTHLGKGIFLVTRWNDVPLWEINFLTGQNIDLYSMGIVRYEGKYKRLIFAQVDDLDHAYRQQDHILDKYFAAAIDLYPDFAELCRAIEKENKIVKLVAKRQEEIDTFRKHLLARLRSFRKTLESLIKNAPLFTKANPSENEIQPILNVLNRARNELSELAVRPVSRNLNYASRSLYLAINHILVGRHNLSDDSLDLSKARFKLAKDRLKSALKNLEYPKEEK